MAEGSKIRIGHIITGLDIGGAEIMLYRLLKSLPPDHFDCQVISLTQDGPVGAKIAALGIPVRALGMKPSLPNPFHLVRLAKWLRTSGVHVVQTWMYHADLVGGLAAWLAGDIPLAWGIHNTTLAPRTTKRSTRMIVKVNALLSKRLPDRIITCSESALRLHAHLGYAVQKMQVIPNGFDLKDFKPDPEAPAWLRLELGLSSNSLLIGHVARFDPQKDHQTLLDAAKILHEVLPMVHFILCGDGITLQNECLVNWIRQRDLQGVVHSLGRREDVSRITAAFDLATLTSSYGEAFPNVVGEAMSCEVPCVVTDVGDCEMMVGNTGKVVPPGNPIAIADAWLEILTMAPDARQQMGKTARARVQENFLLSTVSERYAKVYRSLASS